MHSPTPGCDTSGAPETAPALVVSAPVGLVLAANGAFCAHTGYVENDILGRPLHTGKADQSLVTPTPTIVASG